MRYRVWAQSISDVYLDVEAENEREAIEIAEAADGGEFIDAGGYSGDFIIGEAEALKE